MSRFIAAVDDLLDQMAMDMNVKKTGQ